MLVHYCYQSAFSDAQYSGLPLMRHGTKWRYKRHTSESACNEKVTNLICDNLSVNMVSAHNK